MHNIKKDFFHSTISVFFVAAVENAPEKTEYLCETITHNSLEIRLTDDKFADFLDVRNHGFVAIPNFNMASLSTQELKLLQEAKEGQQTFYSDEVLMKFAKEQGVQIEDNEKLEDEDIESETAEREEVVGVMDFVLRNVIDGHELNVELV